jgi:hypothetical protein
MPFTRPAEISDCVSLADKLGRAIRAFIPEGRTVDASLAAIVDELAPNKESVSVSGSENDVLAGSDELRDLPLPAPSLVGVVLPVECETGSITVLRQIPEGLIHQT